MIVTCEQALKYYNGSARNVVVTTDCGQRIQFPAEHIRRFIKQDGIRGRFCISFDANNKLMKLEEKI